MKYIDYNTLNPSFSSELITILSLTSFIFSIYNVFFMILYTSCYTFVCIMFMNIQHIHYIPMTKESSDNNSAS